MFNAFHADPDEGYPQAETRPYATGKVTWWLLMAPQQTALMSLSFRQLKSNTYYKLALSLYTTKPIKLPSSVQFLVK